MADRPIRIAVCGAGTAGDDVLAAARQVGEALAEAGAVLLCGGLGGVMEAAAEGAEAAGGLTLGLLPGTDAAAANPHIALPLPTGLGEARNAVLVRAADAVIAVAGEWGTLSEVALARKMDVPVVLLMPSLAAGLGLDQVGTPREAVAKAIQAARAGRSRK